MKKFTSRKFLMALAGILFIVATQILGIQVDEESYYTVVGAVIAYVIGETVVDATRNKNDQGENN